MQSDCVDLLHVRTYKQNISNILMNQWYDKINHPKLWDQNLPGPGASPMFVGTLGTFWQPRGAKVHRTVCVLGFYFFRCQKIEDRKSAFLDFACTWVEIQWNVIKNSKSCVFWGHFSPKHKDFHWNLVILFESICRMGADLVFWLVWGLECFQGELLEIPELHAGGRSCCETAGWLVAVDLLIPGPSKKGYQMVPLQGVN